MRVLSAAAIVAAALAHSACGGGSSSITGPDPGAITITITRQNGAQSFSPNPAAAGGQLVMFRNNDTVAHRVRLNDGSIDTGNISPGGTSAVVRMPLDGTNYHCELHPDMIGAVSGTSGQPPDCVGIYCGVG
jgi:plastocyanin